MIGADHACDAVGALSSTPLAQRVGDMSEFAGVVDTDPDRRVGDRRGRFLEHRIGGAGLGQYQYQRRIAPDIARQRIDRCRQRLQYR
ncbi:hypothetical protein [Cupriavidus pauculus]|uniref:hypothetical protein n=1 Tax=Cupriavidus pauculus TaxID=82633 RepID=UPI003857E2E1